MSMSVGVLDHYNVSTRNLRDTVRFYEAALGWLRYLLGNEPRQREGRPVHFGRPVPGGEAPRPVVTLGNGLNRGLAQFDVVGRPAHCQMAAHVGRNRRDVAIAVGEERAKI